MGLPSATPTSQNAGRWFLMKSSVYLFLLVNSLLTISFFTKQMIARTTISSSLKKIETQTAPESENDNTSVFYNTTWPPLRKVLCGEGAPNLMLSSKLFELARSEVFLKDSANCDPHLRQCRALLAHWKRKYENVRSKTQSKFFSGEYGASLFQGVNEKGGNFASLYVRIWKCGNNQIRSMEQRLFKHFNGTYLREEGLRLEGALDTLNKVAATQNENLPMPQPCIYTAVRDPISHFLSGFNEIQVRELGATNNQSSIALENAPYHRDVPYSSESPELRKQRFKAFVEDLLLEDEIFHKEGTYQHVFSMSRVLVELAKHKIKLSGYISKMEHLTTDWPEFMSSTCQGFPSRELIPKMKKRGQHPSSKDPLGFYRAAKDVWEEFGPISRSLCLLHAVDYACWEDLPDGIPEICQSVYQDYSEELVRFGTEHYMLYE